MEYRHAFGGHDAVGKTMLCWFRRVKRPLGYQSFGLRHFFGLQVAAGVAAELGRSAVGVASGRFCGNGVFASRSAAAAEVGIFGRIDHFG